MTKEQSVAGLLQTHGQPKVLAKQTHVFYQGDHDARVYFVQSGLLKAYYLSADGKESIKSFIEAGSIIGSLNAALGQGGCSFNLVALEPSQLLGLPFATLVEAAAQSHTLAGEVIQHLLALAMKKEQREYELLSLSAEQRFVRLRQTSPELLKRVTQNDIARYLGVTPVALSRIKKRGS
ncbi:Crp/Fnr family transcriptional regulator [Gilvimarinus sp. SDUM040013]|uniref:Crp/Fnr family transcriptional regulator n=1 Tax=Gilvimarinus gilvus TaxID=3058038 RepID=A0ABU4S4Q3_9GAMM|nr:Crp/Fnr family transcriptional regulator [Gilvimarinus sp. SDUM040013]MDO3384789.1 Crp/Fnr family transcriptional regulator [Gilvimarinus sp. SDUM040013]MDX6850878.1 Crp/Fnr family transcriptional regulator [Gilvimarinus sp. SDUM040013]